MICFLFGLPHWSVRVSENKGLVYLFLRLFLDEQMYEQMGRQMDGWMDGPTDEWKQ